MCKLLFFKTLLYFKRTNTKPMTVFKNSFGVVVRLYVDDSKTYRFLSSSCMVFRGIDSHTLPVPFIKDGPLIIMGEKYKDKMIGHLLKTLHFQIVS